MKIFLPSILLFLSISLQAFSHDHQDSVNVDRQKMETVIGEIRNCCLERWKAPEGFDIADVVFSYPDKFIPGETFPLDVFWKGERLLACKVDTEGEGYKLGGVIDLR